MKRDGLKTILCTIGTRPEAIKMAPVIRAFRSAPWARCRVLSTGQHRELVDTMLGFFGIEPDLDLDIMRPNQTLVELTARLLPAVHDAIGREQPAIVLGQGDTTTVLATAMASFYHKVPFGHVEAGLRTHRLYAPFPEEANRVLAGHLSALHFAPTASSRENLIREGIHGDSILITGNTVIDALFMAVDREIPIGVELDPTRRMVLVTAHRRDSFGEPIRQICRAIRELHDRFPDVEFLWPVHPNPSIKPVVEAAFVDRPRVRLCEPLAYGPFVSAMKRATLILTDSGGVQEEAPALGKPVLVLRDESERPEAISAGVARLVGHDPRTIVSLASRLLDDPEAYRAMVHGVSPYGDGMAAERIVAAVGRFLGVADTLKAAG
ncbi:MAG: non-hydrolyzing UDP-N-acetylglucosamine 2-epimerase [Isosphaeraceae bacterium]